MTAASKDGGGNFRELRDRHLPLFDLADHRHDRGWPHPPRKRRDASLKETPGETSTKGWKTVGIFHFRADHDED